VLTEEAREELWNPKPRVEAAAKPKMFQAEAKAASNGASNGAMNGNINGNMNGNANGNTNGKYKPFNDLDDDINLEIGDGGFY
jgi:hypothetical protein